LPGFCVLLAAKGCPWRRDSFRAVSPVAISFLRGEATARGN
jgi:hypothetical protein